jgi:hypothetical protein
MTLELRRVNQVLITISVIFGSIALTLASVGIGSPNWQNTYANTTSGDVYIIRTANFFYACRLNSLGIVLRCGERSTNSSILQYYSIVASGNESELNFHLNTASGFTIIGIIFIFFGIIITLSMFCGDRAEWIYPVAPTFLFVACLFMLAGLAEGSRVLLYNGYAAYLYESAHVLTMFSFLISSIVGGLLFKPPSKLQQLR